MFSYLLTFFFVWFILATTIVVGGVYDTQSLHDGLVETCTDVLPGITILLFMYCCEL